MKDLNIVEILKLGLPGLVFLLSTLSYRLLSKEQEKKHPAPDMLSSIRNFMYINVTLAILTLISPIIDNTFFTKSHVFDIEARTGILDLEEGKAAVCQNVGYANRYLLIKDKKTQKLIQVFASLLTPCRETTQIVLSARDISTLGWSAGTHSSAVEVVTALPGYKFEI